MCGAGVGTSAGIHALCLCRDPAQHLSGGRGWRGEGGVLRDADRTRRWCCLRGSCRGRRGAGHASHVRVMLGAEVVVRGCHGVAGQLHVKRDNLCNARLAVPDGWVCAWFICIHTHAWMRACMLRRKLYTTTHNPYRTPPRCSQLRMYSTRNGTTYWI